jgi:hypothetical protein
MFKRFVSHYWSKIRTTDTHVDHIANALTGVTFPRTVSHLLTKAGHLVEHRVNAGYDVMTINEYLLISSCAQCYMQDCPALGDVDLVAPKHGLDA